MNLDINFLVAKFLVYNFRHHYVFKLKLVNTMIKYFCR